MMKTNIVVLIMMWLMIMTDPPPTFCDDWTSFNTRIERFVTFKWL